MEGRSCPSFPLEHMKSGSFPGALCSGGSSSLPLCPREGEKEHGGQPRVNPQWVWLPDNRMGGMRSELHLLCLSISKRQQSEGGKVPWGKRKWDRQSVCIFVYPSDHFPQLELSWMNSLCSLCNELITQESLWLWPIVALSLHLCFKRAQGHSDTGHLKTVWLFLIQAPHPRIMSNWADS